VKELVLGGVRSGKSRYAEQRARESGLSVVCVATATAHDEEMRARIHAHQERRPASWTVVETPRALAATLQQQQRNPPVHALEGYLVHRLHHAHDPL